jgi:hypothetical protein
VAQFLDFMERLIEENQGLVERDLGDQGLRAMVSGKLMSRLEIESSLVDIREGTKTKKEGEICVGFGTSMLERAIDLAMEQGRLAAVRMPEPSAKKKVGEILERQLTLLNAVYDVVGEQMSSRDYWVWTFETIAEADEREEGVCQVCLSSELVALTDIVEEIHARASTFEELAVDPLEQLGKRFDAMYAAAADRALDIFETRLSQFRSRVERHMRRDSERITSYFAELRDEMEEEIKRRRLKGDALQIRREKQEQLTREEASKLLALGEKYNIQLGLEPQALLMVRIPVIRCDLIIKRRQAERRLSVVYNLLSKRIDPLSCEACGVDLWDFGLCDQALHVLCSRCLSKAGSRNKQHCPACAGERRPGTLEEVIKRRGL